MALLAVGLNYAIWSAVSYFYFEEKPIDLSGLRVEDNQFAVSQSYWNGFTQAARNFMEKKDAPQPKKIESYTYIFERLGISVIGLLSVSDSKGVAIIKTNQGERIVETGDIISGQVKVQNIEPEKIIFFEYDKIFEVMIPTQGIDLINTSPSQQIQELNGSAQISNPNQINPVDRAPSSQGNRRSNFDIAGIKKSEMFQKISSNARSDPRASEILDDIEEDPIRNFPKYVNFVPVKNPIGSGIAVRIEIKRDRQVFENIFPVRSGEVLTKVNGLEAVDWFSETGGDFTNISKITVIRNGQETELML